MTFLEWACSRYQRLFAVSHPEAETLAALHSARKDAEFFRAYFDHEYAKGKETLERFARFSSAWEGGGLGLDFGCGAGGLTYRLREVCDEVIGIDIDEQKLQFAREQAARLNMTGVSFLCYDGTNVPLPDGTFRLILCADVLEHVPSPEFVLKELRRLLHPDGWLLLAFGPPWYHAHGKHMWVKLPGWWTHLLFPRDVVMKLAGFSPTTTWPDLGIHQLSVRKFERARAASGLVALREERTSKGLFAPMRAVPGLRELFIAGVRGVYRAPASRSGLT